MQGIVERGSDTSSGCSSAFVSIIDGGKDPSGGDVSSEPVCPFQIQQPNTDRSTSQTPTEESNQGKLQVISSRMDISSHPPQNLILSSFRIAASNNTELKEDVDVASYLRELSSKGEVFAHLPSSPCHTRIPKIVSLIPDSRKESDISDSSNYVCNMSDSVFTISDSAIEIPERRNSQRFSAKTKEAADDYNRSVAPLKIRVRGRSECSPMGWPSVSNKIRSKFTCSRIIKQESLTAVGLHENSVEMNCSEDGGSSTSGSFRINMFTASGTIFSEIYPSVNV